MVFIHPPFSICQLRCWPFCPTDTPSKSVPPPNAGARAAQVLERGKLLTFDYGFTTDERFSPSRVQGTLRAYYRHHASDDVLANVGEQDLTAHVNFSEIQKAGEACRLTTESFSTQAQFLTRILEKTLREKTFGDWSSAQTRQFQTLTHPEHLGRAFRVLVQSR